MFFCIINIFKCIYEEQSRIYKTRNKLKVGNQNNNKQKPAVLLFQVVVAHQAVPVRAPQHLVVVAAAQQGGRHVAEPLEYVLGGSPGRGVGRRGEGGVDGAVDGGHVRELPVEHGRVVVAHDLRLVRGQDLSAGSWLLGSWLLGS